MSMLLFLVFIAVPIAEVALFIQAGQLIGIIPTILITIGTAIAGSILMRVQGFQTMNNLAQSLEKGEMPVTPVIDGIGIMAAGLLLLTPGFLTDTIGLLLFVPPIRRGLAKWLLRRALSGGRIHIRTFEGDARGPGPEAGPGPRPRSGGKRGFRERGNVVDADFETVEPGKTDGKAEPLEPGGDDGRRPPRRSPWRQG
jgi:UPF0716 protein FxsA